MTSLLLICDVDEYIMDGSCKNKLKFGYFGVSDEEPIDSVVSSNTGFTLLVGRVSKRFRGRKPCFTSEAKTLEVVKLKGATSCFIEVEFEAHQKKFCGDGEEVRE